MPAEECLIAISTSGSPAEVFVLHVLIIANGELEAPPDLPKRLRSIDLIIAADGGGRHCRRLGLHPDLLIGDLDSIPANVKAEMETEGVRVLAYPPEKDQTDLELALLHAKQVDANQVLVLAGLGRRWDHSVANLLLAAHPQFSEQHILFLQGEQQLFVLRRGAQLEASPRRVGFPATSGRRCRRREH